METSYDYAVLYCYIHQYQQTNTCPKSTKETQGQAVKYNQSCQESLQDDVIDNEVIALLWLLLKLKISHIFLVFLLLTLNMYLFSGFDLIFQSFLN